jgi:hypothetical protein
MCFTEKIAENDEQQNRECRNTGKGIYDDVGADKPSNDPE